LPPVPSYAASRAQSALTPRVAARMREFGASALWGFFNNIDVERT
jgi:hypothetical protein